MVTAKTCSGGLVLFGRHQNCRCLMEPLPPHSYLTRSRWSSLSLLHAALLSHPCTSTFDRHQDWWASHDLVLFTHPHYPLPTHRLPVHHAHMMRSKVHMCAPEPEHERGSSVRQCQFWHPPNKTKPPLQVWPVAIGNSEKKKGSDHVIE